ncbi:MAG: MiaB/RimO family radical SAM methylthiotransferase [Candidatus Omnitrophica bacterium]|nr:MiaB/RimO family radical SAM methylthiotransferase [Candidatus Omnitrophota bacterium]
MPQKTVSIISLGCFRNTVDSERVAYRYAGQGYAVCQEGSRCHTLVINTCGFIQPAKEESLEMIRDAIEWKQRGRVKKIVVIGCLVQRYRTELRRAFPEVDQWAGVEEFPPSGGRQHALFPAHLAFVKICEGCLHRCSYCAIPSIKGPLRSRSQNEIVGEVRAAAERGVRELNIIGQDITSWGKDFRPPREFSGLLRKVVSASGTVPWIRLLYTHPRFFSDALIDFIAETEKICSYVDLPLQHVNDRILGLMGRSIKKKEMLRLVKRIRKRIPGVVIRTSLIVGFPTETEEEFRELCEFVAEMKFERLGVFVFSREEGTRAYDMPQVHHSTRQRRFRELMELQKRIAQEVNSRFIGRELEVLVEEQNDDILIGRSRYDAFEVDGVVYVQGKSAQVGSMINTKIVDAYEYDLTGI